MSRPSRADRALVLSSAAAVVILAIVATRAALLSWPFERELELLRGSGWLACGALLLSLSMTPLGRVERFVAHRRGRKSLSPGVWMAYRRALGIVAAAAALIHGALTLCTYLFRSWQAVLDQPYLRSGLVALLILLALLLTSFPSWVAKLGLKGWKELHRLAYVAALLVLHHLLLGPFAPRGLTLALFGLCVLIAPLRLLRVRRVAKTTEAAPLDSSASRPPG